MTLLPPNATNLERALAHAVRQPALPVPLRDLWSPDDCPEYLLPWLAWAVSIDNWSPVWSLAVKRERVRQAIPIQRIKGTRQSVEDAIAALGGNVEIFEWFERVPPAAPYTFDLVLDLTDDEGDPPSEAFLDSVIREVDRTKPLRAHFTVTQELKGVGGIGFEAAARAVAYTRLQMEVPPDLP